MRLNRKQKIVRNMALCILMVLGIYAAMDFPPYTVDAMCRRMQANNLLPSLELVYVLKEKHSYSGEMFQRRFTYIIGRSGDYFVSFQYDWYLLNNQWDRSREVEIAEGTLCTARNGTMYIAGDFADAAAATAVVRAEKGEKVREFTLEGEKLTDEVFGFDVSAGEGYFPFQEENVPEDEKSLAALARYWYRTSTGDRGYSLDHAELPVTLILYDESGAVIDTRALTIGTYDLHSWR